MKIITNNQPRHLLTLAELPDKVAGAEFDYVTDNHAPRFFKYRGAWYDTAEFVRIAPRARAVGFEHPADVGSPLLDWHGIQTASYFSAVVVRLADDDSVIVGRASW